MPASHPYFKFYVGDWRKNIGIQSLLYQDRGVLTELLCFMHESEVRGKLIQNGVAIPDDGIARLLGLDRQVFSKTIQNILLSRVLSRCSETGALMSDWMVKEELLRRIREESGRKGGNPQLLLLNQNSTIEDNQNTELELELELERLPDSELTDAPCAYCGASEQQVGRPHQREHFYPIVAGGGNEPENILDACVPCNGAKQGRVFGTIAQCKAWLHWRFWSSGRARYVTHRKVAFSGKPPSSETVELGIKLHMETAAQPSNSRILGTSPNFKGSEQEEMIYAAYPLRVGKPAALKAIRKALEKYEFDFLLNRAMTFGKARGKDTDFCPHPATWFNQERFNDDPNTWAPRIATNGGSNGTNGHARPVSSMDLKNVIQAKTTQANNIRNRYASECAAGTEWSNTAKKKEYFQIKREIEALNNQMANML